jgi:hypothetical protein
MTTISKQDKLLEWVLSRGFMSSGVFSSVDVRRWGLVNYYTSADRMVRKFVEQGILRRIPPHEVILRGIDPKPKVAYYEKELICT